MSSKPWEPIILVANRNRSQLTFQLGPPGGKRGYEAIASELSEHCFKLLRIFFNYDYFFFVFCLTFLFENFNLLIIFLFCYFSAAEEIKEGKFQAVKCLVSHRTSCKIAATFDYWFV